MKKADLKYAVIILLERKYGYSEIIKLFSLPRWKLYQYSKHFRTALELIDFQKLEAAKPTEPTAPATQ